VAAVRLDGVFRYWLGAYRARVRVKADGNRRRLGPQAQTARYLFAALAKGSYRATSREAKCAPTLRLTRCRALSTVFVSHSRRSAITS
jgi:hypothetical protein